MVRGICEKSCLHSKYTRKTLCSLPVATHACEIRPAQLYSFAVLDVCDRRRANHGDGRFLEELFGVMGQHGIHLPFNVDVRKACSALRVEVSSEKKEEVSNCVVRSAAERLC